LAFPELIVKNVKVSMPLIAQITTLSLKKSVKAKKNHSKITLTAILAILKKRCLQILNLPDTYQNLALIAF